MMVSSGCRLSGCQAETPTGLSASQRRQSRQAIGLRVDEFRVNGFRVNALSVLLIQGFSEAAAQNVLLEHVLGLSWSCVGMLKIDALETIHLAAMERNGGNAAERGGRGGAVGL